MAEQWTAGMRGIRQGVAGIVLVTFTACGSSYQDRLDGQREVIEQTQRALEPPVRASAAGRRTFLVGLGPLVGNVWGDSASTSALAALNRYFAASPVGRCDVQVRLADSPWDSDAYLTGEGKEQYWYSRDDSDHGVAGPFGMSMLASGVVLLPLGLWSLQQPNTPTQDNHAGGTFLVGFSIALLAVGLAVGVPAYVGYARAEPYHVTGSSTWNLRLTLRDAVGGKKRREFEADFSAKLQTRDAVYDLRLKADSAGWTTVGEQVRDIIGGLPSCASN